MGERTALYFAWLGFYTRWVAFAAIVGFAVFCFGLSRIRTGAKATAAIVLIFDNELSPFYALFMSIWATVFLEAWKRKQAIYAYRWNSWKYEKSELVRPEWRASTARKSHITGKYELHESTWLYRTRMFASILVIATCIAIVIVTVGCIIIYRVFITYANLSV